MTDASRPSSSARPMFATVGFLIVAAFFLTTEHRAHLFGLLPYLLLLACPLLHMFGHGGHGGHGAHASGARWRASHAAHVPEREDTP